MTQKVLIYGGSFDPIHKGHLLPLKDLVSQHPVDKVIFVPCFQQPLKGKANVSGQQRLELLELAVNNSNIAEATVSDIEIQRGGKSYTFDTLAYFKDQNKDSELYFVMGMDSLYSLHKWHKWREIIQLSQVLVMNRGGENFDLTRVDKQVSAYLNNRIRLVDTLTMEVSSTEIRHHLAVKQFDKLVNLLTPEVLQSIQVNQLYLQD